MYALSVILMGPVCTDEMKETTATESESELYIPASTIPPHLGWIETKVSTFLSSIRRMPLPGTSAEPKK